MSRGWLLFATLGAAACILTGAATAGGAAKPVISAPKASPTRPQPGQSFGVQFHVSKAKSVTFAVTLNGARVHHSDSFHGGIARTAVSIPATATGSLVVTLTAHAGTATSTRRASFAVQPAPPPSLEIDDGAVDEGASGTTQLGLQVVLSRASTKTVSVAYATSDGTATAPADYVPASGTLTFAPGETSKTVDVQVAGTDAVEADETFSITLSGAVNATIDKGTGTATIHTHHSPSVGSWKGATQNGDFVFFSVTAADTITGFRTNNFAEDCDHDSYIAGSLSWGTQQFAIGADGTVNAHYSGAGAGAGSTESWTITASFTTVAISGTITLNDAFDYQGTHYTCSGTKTFTAAFQG